MKTLPTSATDDVNGRLRPQFSGCLAPAIWDKDRRKFQVVGLVITAWFTCVTPTIGAADDTDLLRSRIYHRSEGDFQKEACTWLGVTMTQQGSRVLDVFPADKISAVEIPGDETIIPSPLLLRVLTEGRFGDNRHLAIPASLAVAGRLWLKDRSCIPFNVLLDPSDNQIAGVSMGLGYVNVPRLPDKCRSFVPYVKPGMTRVEVEKAEADGRITPDGGRTVPFRYERYVIPNSFCGENGEVIKVNVAYKPAVSDAVYFLGNWTPRKPDAMDTVMRVSPKYLEKPYFD